MPPLENEAARAKEAIHAVVARLPIHVSVVIRVYLEWIEGLPRALRHLFQVPVERTLPGRSVDAGRIGDDPIEVEQPGVVLARVNELLVLGCAYWNLLSHVTFTKLGTVGFSLAVTRGTSCAA